MPLPVIDDALDARRSEEATSIRVDSELMCFPPAVVEGANSTTSADERIRLANPLRMSSRVLATRCKYTRIRGELKVGEGKNLVVAAIRDPCPRHQLQVLQRS